MFYIKWCVHNWLLRIFCEKFIFFLSLFQFRFPFFMSAQHFTSSEVQKRNLMRMLLVGLFPIMKNNINIPHAPDWIKFDPSRREKKRWKDLLYVMFLYVSLALFSQLCVYGTVQCSLTLRQFTTIFTMMIMKEVCQSHTWVGKKNKAKTTRSKRWRTEIHFADSRKKACTFVLVETLTSPKANLIF